MVRFLDFTHEFAGRAARQEYLSRFPVVSEGIRNHLNWRNILRLPKPWAHGGINTKLCSIIVLPSILWKME